MSNDTLLTPSVITKDSLVLLANNLVMADKVNRSFEDQLGAKIGTTLTIRKPNRFTVTNGAGLALQDITEPSTNITISNQSQIAFSFNSAALTLVIEEFRERYLKPAMEALANTIDQGTLLNYTSVYNEVGTPGTVPNAFSFLAAVGTRLDEEAATQSDRVLILNPKAYWGMANGLSTLFVTSVSEPALKGFLANIASMEIYLDQNIVNQQTGNYGGTPTVTGAGQTGSSLVTGGWTNSIGTLLNVGDVITIAGVNAVNPQSRTSTGSLRNFVITAQASSNGSGASTLQIFPAITATGAYQNVDFAPAAGATVTVISGASGANLGKNLAFCKDAFGLVTVPMEMPDGVDFKAQEVYKGINLRVIRAYDINSDVTPCRLDVLWGTNTFYSELAVRLTN